jgi:hypothetical protein
VTSRLPDYLGSLLGIRSLGYLGAGIDGRFGEGFLSQLIKAA